MGTLVAQATQYKKRVVFTGFLLIQTFDVAVSLGVNRKYGSVKSFMKSNENGVYRFLSV